MSPKTPVLFLHGASFTSKVWQDLGTMGLLSLLGHKVVAVDLPGEKIGNRTPPPTDIFPSRQFTLNSSPDNALLTSTYTPDYLLWACLPTFRVEKGWGVGLGRFGYGLEISRGNCPGSGCSNNVSWHYCYRWNFHYHLPDVDKRMGD